MALVNDVLNLIINDSDLSTYIVPDNVSVFLLPEELINKTNENVCLITSVGSRRGGYAGDYSTKKFETCQVQVWFKLDNSIEQNDAIETRIIALLEENKIFNRQSLGLDVDPDTFQTYLTLAFWRDKGEKLCY